MSKAADPTDGHPPNDPTGVGDGTGRSPCPGSPPQADDDDDGWGHELSYTDAEPDIEEEKPPVVINAGRAEMTERLRLRRLRQ